MSAAIGDAARTASAPSRSLLSRAVLLPVAVLVLALAALYGWHWYTVGRFFVETDDAFLASDDITIAPRVSGYVTEADVTDNQSVRAGQVLARIDDRDYRAVLAQGEAEAAQARAGVAAAEAQITEQRSAIAQAQADVDSDRAQMQFAGQEYKRAHDLSFTSAGTVQSDERTRAQVTEAVAALRHAEAALDAANGRVATLIASRDYVAANLGKAQADIARAQINLDDTVLRAPVDGVVGDRSLRHGNYVQAGQGLLTVVPVGHALYVTANYKETQLPRVRVGQPVRITVDAFGGHAFDGRVDGLSPGTGSEFALLPPENATGNYTKIVQRVPVKIRLVGNDPLLARLRAGLSVNATIDTRGDDANGGRLPTPASPTGS